MPSIPVRLLFGLALLLIATVYISGQTAPFEKYRFEDGGYEFVGIFSHHSDHPLQKKLGEFYTDDVAVLNQLKKSWRFTRPQRDYACGYHYQLLILKNGIVEDSFVVNLECNQLRTATESLYFKLNKLDSFSNSFRKLYRRHNTFSRISEAKTYLAAIRTTPFFVYVSKPRWSEFEGEFRFHLTSPLIRHGNSTEFEALKPKLEAEIKATYPENRLSSLTVAGQLAAISS